MLQTTVSISCLLASAALPATEGLRFAPAEGVVLTKLVGTEVTLGIDELTSTFNGQPVPEEYLPDLQVDVRSRSRIVLSDEYHAVGRGRPLRFTRTYETIDTHEFEEVTLEPGGGSLRDEEGASELEGRTVSFEWNEEEEEYRRSFPDGDGPGELLSDLREDLDFRDWLPESEVAEGETWTIDAHALAVFDARELGLAVEYERGSGRGEPQSQEGSGELRLKWTGTRDVEGRRMAVVRIEGEAIYTESRPTNLDHIPVADGTATEVTETRNELEGELLWDLEGGHLHSLRLEGELRVESVTTKDPGQDGPSFASTVTMNGSFAARAEFQATRP